MSFPLPAPPHLPTPGDIRWRQRRNALALIVVGGIGVIVWRHYVTRPDYRLARGQDAIKAMDWDSVQAFATRLEDNGHPNHAHFLRGESHFARHRPDLALSEFNQIQDAGPLRLQAAAHSGRCLIDLGNLSEAARVLTFVIGEQPDNVEAHRGLAVIAYDLGQSSTAVDHLEAVARLDPVDARPHRLIGLIYKDMAQYEKAATAYREALTRKLPPKVAGEVYLELAEVLVRLAQFSEGLEALDADVPLESVPSRSVIRAECLRGLGRRQEAAELLDRVSVRTSTAEMYRVRGQLYLDEGKSVDAVRVFEQAAALAPVEYQVHYLLAQAYSAAGRQAEAAKTLARAEDLRKDFDLMTRLSRDAIEKPWDPGVRLQLAELSDRLGKPQLAAMWRSAAAACRDRRR